MPGRQLVPTLSVVGRRIVTKSSEKTAGRRLATEARNFLTRNPIIIMANTERTFLDRHARGITLQATIAALTPPFTPSNSALGPVEFQKLLDQCQAANTKVESVSSDYTTKVSTRTDLVKASKQRGSRVMAQVKSNGNWKAHLEPVARHVAKLNNQRVSRPKPPAEGETEESDAKKRRNQGELGHAEMAQHLRNIASALAQIPAYTVPAEDLTVGAIETLATTYETLNREMATLDQDVARQRTARKALYDGETGLKETMKSIKNAVKAQYGTASAQYLEVRAVRV